MMCFITAATGAAYLVFCVFFCMQAINEAFVASLEILTVGMIPDSPDPYDFNYMKQVQFFERNLTATFRVPIVMPFINKLRKTEQYAERLHKPALPDFKNINIQGYTDSPANSPSSKSIGENQGKKENLSKDRFYFKMFMEYQNIWGPWEKASKEMFGLGVVEVCHSAGYLSLARFDTDKPATYWLGMTLHAIWSLVASTLYLMIYPNHAKLVAAHTVSPAIAAVVFMLSSDKQPDLLLRILIQVVLAGKVYVSCNRCFFEVNMLRFGPDIHFDLSDEEKSDEALNIPDPLLVGSAAGSNRENESGVLHTGVLQSPDIESHIPHVPRPEQDQRFRDLVQSSKDKMKNSFAVTRKLRAGIHLVGIIVWGFLFIVCLIEGWQFTTKTDVDARILSGSHAVESIQPTGFQWPYFEVVRQFLQTEPLGEGLQLNHVIFDALQSSVRGKSTLNEKVLAMKRELGLDSSLTLKESLAEISQQISMETLALLLRSQQNPA
jgi:hypothetical protein